MGPVPACSQNQCRCKVSLDELAHPANLRACVEAISNITGASVNAVLEEMTATLERLLSQRSDDMEAVIDSASFSSSFGMSAIASRPAPESPVYSEIDWRRRAVEARS